MSPSSSHSVKKSLSMVVIEAVADQRGVEPLELPEKLYDVIDPESLDSLFTSGTMTDGTVSFSFCGHRVTVTADGDVSVEEEQGWVMCDSITD